MRDPTLQDSFQMMVNLIIQGKYHITSFIWLSDKSQLERGRREGLRELVVARDERETKISEGKPGGRGGC